MGNLEERMTTLEGDMVLLREEWTSVQQAPLINARMLNSLRETQLEHSRTLAEHSRTLAEHSRTLAEHSRTLAEHSADLAELKQGVGTMTAMLTTLIEREN